MDLVKDLTKRQREIFDYIGTYLSKHGYPPTVREIGKAVGLAFLLDGARPPLQAREPRRAEAGSVQAARARGDGPAGQEGRRPRASRWSGRSLPASRSWPRRTSRTTSRCRTWSAARTAITSSGCAASRMKDAGILEGDFVVVRPTERARDGEIVVALVGDEATVKRFFREKDQVRLQPENKSMKPIRTRDVRLLGRVVGVFRRVS